MSDIELIELIEWIDASVPWWLPLAVPFAYYLLESVDGGNGCE